MGVALGVIEDWWVKDFFLYTVKTCIAVKHCYDSNGLDKSQAAAMLLVVS